MNTQPEKNTYTPDTNVELLRSTGQEQSEQLRQQHEHTNELSPDKNEQASERARVEALENAVSVEKQSTSKEKTTTAPRSIRRGAINKHELDANYKRTMKHVQAELSPSGRAFSKVIHHKAIERTSDVLGATVARPNAILAGAIGAFVITLAIYLLAKHFGYRLSGFETIGGFALGWVLGLLFDYFKVMITGKRA